VVPREAPPYEPLAFTLAPEEPARVLLASLELPPGAYFRPPTSSCQDVLILVREGELEASGTGIAPSDARASLYEGDAVRFGPEGDGLLVNPGERIARTILAVARDARRFVRTSGWESLAPQGGDCTPLDRPLGASPLRVGSIATTEPLAAGPELTVRILLDTEGQGAENAGLSVLDGAPTFAAPSHVHEGSAEILLVDEGSGVLTLGEREIPVRPGARFYIPAGVPHAFRGDGSSRLRAVQLYAPAGPEQRFRPSGE
jgi:mannose-6-phosphate isomerase-like protein (cupin superfamily)